MSYYFISVLKIKNVLILLCIFPFVKTVVGERVCDTSHPFGIIFF